MIPPQLVQALRKAAAQLRDSSSHLVSHFDADGLAACAIISTALDRKGIEHTTRALPNLGQEQLDNLNKEGTLVLVDVGSTLTLPEGTILIDHHQSALKNELNPCSYGLDGSRDACSTTIAFLLAKELDEQNNDLAPLALVGILADAQEKQGLHALNKLVVEQGIVDGYIKEEERLRLMGYERKSLLGLLIGSHDLKIKGVTGNPKGARQFLERLGIPARVEERQTRFNDLTTEEKEALLEEGKKAASRQPPTAPYYSFPHEEGILRDARQYATLLNACGRLEKAELAIRICKGDVTDTESILQEYSEQLRSAFRWQKEHAERVGKHVLIDAGREILPSMIGTVCSMLTRGGDVPEGTYVLGLSRNTDATTKVSLRVAGFNGKDVNALLTQIMEDISGESGGHKHAAGAVIATSDEERFLENARQLLRNL